MRIFIDVRSLLEPAPSGVSAYTRYLVHALLAGFPQDHFVLFSNALKIGSLKTEFLKYKNVTLSFHRIPNKLLHALFAVVKFPSLKRLAGSCDVYFFPNPMYVPSLPHPSVFTVHDLSYLKRPSYYSLRSMLWHWAVKARSMLKNSDVLIADSEATKIDAQNVLGERKQKIFVVNPAVPQNTQLKPLSPKHFLFIGNIEERKNINGLVSAYLEFWKPGTPPLILVGKRGHLTRSTKKILHESTQEKKIIEMGFIANAKKEELLASSYALVFPSYFEGFGFPVLEAQAMGIPVIVSNRTSLPAIANPFSIIVDPFNISAIKKAFEYALSHIWEKYPVENPFSNRTWGAVADEMMKIFKETQNDYAHRN